MDHHNQQQQRRPVLITSFWEDENTLCYMMDLRGICVARRRDNDMVNGTKLLNIVGMSRGRRDEILRSLDGVRVRVGAMHLKGVWIPLYSAVELARQFNVSDILHPLLADDPSQFVSLEATAEYYRLPAHSHI
ncbi:DNA-binding domain of Mlu1-box binding protein MBP1 [Lichtheimia hyalospora FSU 10163]|nr:DNA-binding domain of Mlu1-box binding protein MBP1 [Lichtheimia hyalospora FSU 10163]